MFRSLLVPCRFEGWNFGQCTCYNQHGHTGHTTPDLDWWPQSLSAESSWERSLQLPRAWLAWVVKDEVQRRYWRLLLCSDGWLHLYIGLYQLRQRLNKKQHVAWNYQSAVWHPTSAQHRSNHEPHVLCWSKMDGTTTSRPRCFRIVQKQFNTSTEIPQRFGA